MVRSTLDARTVLGLLKRRKERACSYDSRNLFLSTAHGEFSADIERISVIHFYRSSLLSICSCYFDNVGIYEGDLIVPDKRLGLICGNLTMHLPIFRSESNSMVVNFNADSSRHFEGFTAKVLSSMLSAGYNFTLDIILPCYFTEIIAFMHAIIIRLSFSSFICQYCRLNAIDERDNHRKQF